MLGAIAGDVIGSIYERAPIKTTNFPLFDAFCTYTDDSVLTVAVADAILSGARYGEKLREYYHRYPRAGYGGMFMMWAISKREQPYNSWGNGAAMRVSPVGYAFDTLDQVLREAERTAEVTHNHPEGIKGAQATAAAVFLARSGRSKDEIEEYVTGTFGYNLDEPLDSIRRWYRFDPSCAGTVPPALTAFLDSDDYEDAIRKAISLGGDSDTLACITGGVAAAFYGGVPASIRKRVLAILDPPLAEVVAAFEERYACRQF